MAGELLIFDAAGSNPDGTDPGTALNVGPGTNYALRALSAPAPPQTLTWAGSADTEGSLLASRKHENRVLGITVLCSTPAALRTLQGKVGKIAREGGTLKWVLPNAETIIFDLHSADTFEPTIDKLHYVRAGAFCEVQMTFPAKPYGRGAEEDLGDNTETTLPCLIFTDTGVKGDMPGLGRLVIDNDGANTQHAVRWGIQSRYYSSAATAALFYQAESCALAAASIATGPSGASGGASNNTVFFGSLPQIGAASIGLIYIGTSATVQTHTGSYRVIARVQAPGTNVGVAALRVTWNPMIGAPSSSTDWAYMSGDGSPTGGSLTSVWLDLDLGEVSIPVARPGSSQGWLGLIDGVTTVSGGTDEVYIDWVMLLPILEGSGEHIGTLLAGDEIEAGDSVHIRHDGALLESTAGYLAQLGKYEGDYLFVPPAGPEGRTLRVIVKMSSGGGTSTSQHVVDPDIDDLSARLFYTPRYLVVPSA